MSITNVNKQIDVTHIDSEGTLKVTLGLSASPDISSHPADIVLVLDCSSSMAGIPLANMQAGAKTFLNMMDEATDGAQDGTIGSGSRIGIVSVHDQAVTNTQLITSMSTLKMAVDSLTADGSNNYADALTTAMQLFDPASTNTKVIVMFTDAKITAEFPPASVIAAKSSGIILYCIGLIHNHDIDVNTCHEWATDPHVAVTQNDAELKDLFAEFAQKISKPRATNIVIDETVHPDFSIVSVSPPDKGAAIMVNSNMLQWKIPELGASANESATLEFFIQHIGQNAGTKPVSQSTSYRDAEGNVVKFPEPSVHVECDRVVHQESCPEPVDLTVCNCHDSLVIDLGDTYLESLGRIVQLDVTIKNVCPNKRVALGVILTETDSHGIEHQRGMKAMTIPAHHYPSCRDILVKCIKFVLPEDCDVSDENPKSLCHPRNLKARFIAHNMDTDFRCCDCVVSI